MLQMEMKKGYFQMYDTFYRVKFAELIHNSFMQ
jgi:hypothetical protein